MSKSTFSLAWSNISNVHMTSVLKNRTVCLSPHRTQLLEQHGQNRKRTLLSHSSGSYTVYNYTISFRCGDCNAWRLDEYGISMDLVIFYSYIMKWGYAYEIRRTYKIISHYYKRFFRFWVDRRVLWFYNDGYFFLSMNNFSGSK